MKIVFTIGVLLFAIHFAKAESTTQRDAPTVRFYDGRGNATGSASSYGNQTRFYDARGNSVGTATHRGGKQ
jgi:hypothetical protein